MVQEEIWKDIDGYERLYQVSNMGRVKRVKGYDSLGHLRNEKILKPIPNKYGYLKVNLFKEGKQKMFSVHRLVGMTFIPNPEGLPQINHIDEDKTNNRVDNLEWCDCKYNINYGTHQERQVQTKIGKGLYDPKMCGIIKNEGKKEYNRMLYQKDREKRLEYARLMYQENREKKLEYQREYNKKNREKINERDREYYQKNREKKSEYQREYRQKNREKILEYQREYRRRKKSA